MYYYSIKHLHVLFVVLSVLFLLARYIGLNSGSLWAQRRWLKLLHHLSNSLMVIFGFTLAAMLGASQPWILMKIVGLGLYLLAGWMALQSQRRPPARLYALISALIVYVYTIGVALNHSPASWFA